MVSTTLELFSALVGMNVIIPSGGILADNDDGGAKTGSPNIEYLWDENDVVSTSCRRWTNY